MPVRIFITGQPGSGKSRLVQEIVQELGIRAGGIITPEIRKDGRAGFRIIDIASGRQGILAAVDIKGPRVSKYGVNLKDIEEIGVTAVKKALEDPEVKLIVIDELGKMELCSRAFRDVVQKALESDKDLLVVLHRALVGKYKKHGRVFILTTENRKDVKVHVLEILGKCGR